MRAVLLDPFACTITEVDHDGNYRSIYPLISHETQKVDHFDAVYLDHGDAIMVDDEGLLKDPQRFFLIRGFHAPLAGKGLCLGSDSDGETVAAKTPLQWFKSNIAFAMVDATGTRLIRATPWTRTEGPNNGTRH